jgi:hypothetical protein
MRVCTQGPTDHASLAVRRLPVLILVPLCLLSLVLPGGAALLVFRVRLCDSSDACRQRRQRGFLCSIWFFGRSVRCEECWVASARRTATWRALRRREGALTHRRVGLDPVQSPRGVVCAEERRVSRIFLGTGLFCQCERVAFTRRRSRERRS